MTASSITTNVMLGTALLGATAGAIGTFAVLRRRALVGDMLSHAALPGVCIAFLIMQSRNFVGLSIGALGATVYGCTRRSEHKFTCSIGAVAFDGAICTGVVKVSYKNHKAETPTRRVVSGPDCLPVELPGFL